MPEWDYNDLISWDDEANPHPNVKALNISNNNLTSLPEKIFKLTSLEYLYCNKNNLKVLPKQLFELNKLVLLNCRDNMIKEIPKEISLSSLVVLNCSNNCFVDLPNEIIFTANLSQIYSYGNPYGNHFQLKSQNNSLEEIKRHFRIKGIKLSNAKELMAKEKIKAFISQYVIPKYYDVTENIYLYI